ncbi:MAG: DnaA N-terminal domain-containing protein [Gemmobacter sp.]
MVQLALQAENPALFAAWFAMLVPLAAPEGHLRLKTPTRFLAAFVTTHHLDRLLALAHRADPGIAAVEVSG